MKQTKRCIRCLRRKAVTFSGHVLKKGEQGGILAGWCTSCYDRHMQGFYGHWRRDMKIEEA